jgi:hypothetical protein
MAFQEIRPWFYVLPRADMPLNLSTASAHGDPQRAVALLRLQAQREQYVAGLQFVRGACRSRGHGYAFGVKEKQQRFAFNIFEAEIQISGKPHLHGSIDPGVFYAIKYHFGQFIPQISQPPGLRCHLLARNVRCLCQADDARHVLRSRTQASFVSAALHYVLQFCAPPNVERPHAFGSVELVGGKG